MIKFDEDDIQEQLREEVEELLEDYIPFVVTCPLCEREFEFDLMEWDRLVDAMTEFIMEHCEV